jgi:hypothetical protein
MKIYGYDFDGVISIGITPQNEDDVIITGRCMDEKSYVNSILESRGIKNKVYFNPMTLEERGNHTVEARTHSGLHKANTIIDLMCNGVEVIRFFEDDEIQKSIIEEAHEDISVVHIKSNLVEK